MTDQPMDWGQDAPVFNDSIGMPGTLPPLSADQQKQNSADFQAADPYAAIDPDPTATHPGSTVATGGFDGGAYSVGAIPYDRLIHAEGGTNPDGSFRTSPKGAWGPAQLMPATLVEAAHLAGLDPDQVRTDAAANKAAGNAYYGKMRGMFGDDAMAAAAYNAGPGRVQSAIARAVKAGNPAGWFQFLPAETQNYLHNVTGQGGKVPAAGAPAQTWGQDAPLYNPKQEWGGDAPLYNGDQQDQGVLANAWGAVKAFGAGIESSAGALVHNTGEFLDAVRNSMADPHYLASLSPADRAQFVAQMPNAGMKLVNGKVVVADQDKFAQATAPTAQAWQDQAASYAPKNPTGIEKAGGAVGGFIPYVAAAVISPALGAVTFGVGGYGTAYDEAKHSGATEEQAQAAGKANAAIQTAIGAIPFEAPFSVVYGTIAKKFGSATAEMVARNLARASGGAAMMGGSQLGENVVAGQTFDPNRPTMQNVPEAAAEGAAAAIGMHVAGRIGQVAFNAARSRFGKTGTGIGGPDAPDAAAGSGDQGPGPAPGEPGGMPNTDAAQNYAGESWGEDAALYHPTTDDGWAANADGSPKVFKTNRAAAMYATKNQIAGQYEVDLHADGTVGLKIRPAEAARRAAPDGAAPATEEQQVHAEEAGAKVTPETSHAQATADIVEAEAAKGEPTHEQANIHEAAVDSLIDPVDAEHLNQHIADSATGEHGTGAGAFPAPEHGDIHAPAPEEAGARPEGAEGSGAGTAPSVGTKAPTSASLTPTASGKGVVLRDATPEQIAAIKVAVPQANASASKDGGLVYSAKHADVIRAVLDGQTQTDASAMPPAGPIPASNEHPGLVIKNIRTGQETMVQPIGTTNPSTELANHLIDLGAGIDAIGAKLGVERGPRDGTLAFAKKIIASHPRETIRRAIDEHAKEQNKPTLTKTETAELEKLRADQANGDLGDDSDIERLIELGAKAKPEGDKTSHPGEEPKADDGAFSDKRAEEAKARMRERMKRMHSGLDPEMLLDGIIIAGNYIKNGLRDFAHFAEAMREDFSDRIVPYLSSFWEGARRYPGLDVEGMTPVAESDAHQERLNREIAKADEQAHNAPQEGSTNAGPTVHSESAGPLETVAAGDVSGAPEGGNLEPGSAAGQPDGGGSGVGTDAAGIEPARGGGIRSARPHKPATGKIGGRKNKPAVNSEDQTPGEQILDANEAIEAAPAVNVPVVNFTITPDVNLGQGSEGVKYQDNVDAITTLKQLEQENRRASPDEQRTLARYVGWGGLKNAFRVAGSKEGEGVAKGWEKRVAELEELLTPDELRSARNSTTAAHYTSQAVVNAMWKAAERIGFKEGAVLEPSVGTGNFLGLMPEHLRGNSRVMGIEYDGLTARIAQKLYPQSEIIHSGFQNIPIPRGQFALAIGNPPFGRESLYFPYNSAVNGKSIHNQFFMSSLDSVAPDGVMAMVVSHNLMDALDNSSRLAMAEKAEFLGGVRLPDTAFKENARTSVVTDMLFFRKRSEAEQAIAAHAIKAIQTGAMPAPGKDIPSTYDINRIGRDIQPWVHSSPIPDPAGSGEMINANPYFLKRPEMVIGDINATGTMNQRADLNVTLANPAEFDARVERAIAMLPRREAPYALAEKTLVHYQVMADSMRLSAARAEPGAVSIDLDKNLKMVVDFDAGTLGKALMREISLTPDTPFSSDYTLTVDGKWQRAGNVLGEDGKPLKVLKDGKATNRNEKAVTTFAREADIPAQDKWGPERIAIVRDLLPIRDAMKRQLVLESGGATDKQIATGRAELNRIYDAFVKAHGDLHSRAVAKIADLMPDGGLTMAAEQIVDGKVQKADIMSRRVTQPPQIAQHAADAADAVAIALSESGRLDIERIAQLLGTDVPGAEKALSEGETPRAFYDPETKLWTARDEYLSGLVRRKLNMARADGMDANAKALEAVVPEDWPAEHITPVLGSNWIPAQVYADFLTHLGYRDTAVSYSELTNSFTVQAKGEPSPQWATSSAAHDPDQIVSKMLNSQGLKVTRRDSDGKTYVDEGGTAESEQKGSELFNEFQDWAYQDNDRRDQLTRIFNDKFNGRLIRQRDGSHLKLFGKVPDSVIKMRRHQLNGIWRGITDPAVLYDHVVGAGKTFTAIARIMERRRMGLSNKPLVVVPNHLVEQWAEDALKLYPGAKVLAAGKADFERTNRRRLFARIAASDFDMAIIGHSSFNFVDLNRETEERYIHDELQTAMAAVKEAEEEAARLGISGGRGKPFGVAEAERLVKKLEERLNRLRSQNRDRLLSFEEMGIDDLTIDEAHEFKNLSYSSRLQNVRGMGNKTGSAKAMDLHLKIRAIRERHNTSVAFLTGTPISNSVSEMYLLLRNLVPAELKELGLENFDAWRSMFVGTGTDWEPTEAGGVKEVSRLGSNWSNMRALMDLYYSVADAVTNEDIAKAFAEDNPGKKYPLPESNSRRVNNADREMVYVKPSPTTVDMLDEVVRGFRNLPDITDPKERNIARLRLMDRARKISLDPRAVDPHIDAGDERGKLHAVADRVAQIYKKWDHEKGTQIIFLDRSVPKSKGDDKIIEAYDAAMGKLRDAISKGDKDAEGKALDGLEKFNPNEIEALRNAQQGGWNGYDELKRQLTAKGIPATEIRYVQEANTDQQKADLFALVKSGKVRVIIGSTPRMGAGTNVQDLLVGLHHVDVTWKPSDIEQREGRIIRQGNKLLAKYGDEKFAVDVMAYATERTIDAKMWDLNARKLKAINGIRKYDGAFNMEFDDEDSASMSEMAAIATGDPTMIERVKLDGEIKKLELQQRSYNNRINAMRGKYASNARQIAAGPQRAEMYTQFADQLDRTLPEVRAASAQRAIEVEGKTYNDRAQALDAAQTVIDKIRGADERARFSININGEQVTSQDGVQNAVRSALGTPDFIGSSDGQPFIDTNDMARALQAKIVAAAQGGFDRPFTVTGLTINGMPVEVDVGSPVGKNRTVSMTLLDAQGRAVDSYGTFTESPSSLPMARSLIERIREKMDPSRFRASASSETRSVDKASGEQDALATEIEKPWPKADELVDKRDRLREVVGILEAKDKAGSGAVQEGSAPYVAEPGSEAYDAGHEQGTDTAAYDAGSPLELRGREDSVPARTRATLQGLGIPAEFERHKAIALVGQVVSHPHELAELAQIYRDPRHETLRVFFTKGVHIVHATGASTRSVSSAPLMPDMNGHLPAFHKWLADTMSSSDADGYYLLHNHPSGDPTPSRPDIDITKHTAQYAPGFKGHVIINSGRFATINARGETETLKLTGAGGPDKLLTPSKPNPILGQKVNDYVDLARVAKQVQRQADGYVTVILTGAKGEVRAVVDMPRENLSKTPMVLMGMLRRYQRMSGGDRAYLVGSDADMKHPNVIRAVRTGMLTEAINEKGNGLTSMVGVGNPQNRYYRAIEGGKARFVAEDSKPFESESPKSGPSAIITRILGKNVDDAGRYLASMVDKAMPDPADEILHSINMGINPMGAGSGRAQAAAKDFSNALRLTAYQWGKVDEWLAKTYDTEQRRRMWEAADQHGVLLRRGIEPGPYEGLNRLSPNERATVEELQRRADQAFAQAKKLGMINGDGLESYVPRMIVEMTASGPKVISKASPRQERRGANLSHTTGQLKQRKYETVEETEAAAQKHFGEGVEVVRDIRTLALATQRLEQAYAGRKLVEKIKEMSKDAGGGPLVTEGGVPDPGAYFTINHPSLQRWGPKFTADAETGKQRPLLDENGDVIFEATPIWISKEFEGPLNAVLRTQNGPVVRALMDLKAKGMGLIMYSPFMHNMVIFGKAFPADPVGMLKLLEPYRHGNELRKDPALMSQAIHAGLVPIGARYFMQDIVGIAAGEGLDIAPGRSWTAQLLAYIPGLFKQEAGDATKRTIDKLGDVWHNTLLWDRISDLQAGLYVHIRDALTRNGLDDLTAQRVAAHYANRYAGAMPIEALSKLATNFANLLLFSRSFTLGNLGAFKDLIGGLPSDVRAQVERDAGKIMLEQAQGLTRRKAIGMFIMEHAMSIFATSLAGAAMAWMFKHVYQSPAENEEGKEHRFLIRYQDDGTAIYGRLPVGKVDEDWGDWLTEPRQTFLNKQSPYARLAYAVVANDGGFGHKLYDPQNTPAGAMHDVSNIAWLALTGVAPTAQIEGFHELANGTAPDKTTAWMQALLPVTGITISRGAPGGPAAGDLFRFHDEQQYQMQQQRPEIVSKIHGGDLPGARAQMTAIGIAPQMQNYVIRTTLNPSLRMSPRQIRDFMLSASPQDRAKFEADRAAATERKGE